MTVSREIEDDARRHSTEDVADDLGIDLGDRVTELENGRRSKTSTTFSMIFRTRSETESDTMTVHCR